MSSQHLSDEAVAAFADGVLTGHAKTRAGRHTAECAECAEAVRVQREAVLVLRTAPAPELPCGLLDRLRGLPDVTPIASPPTVVLPDGTAMLATNPSFGSLAALVPPSAEQDRNADRSEQRSRPPHRITPFAATAAMVAISGVLAAAAVSGDPTPGAAEVVDQPGRVTTVQQRLTPGQQMLTPRFETADVFRSGGR